MFGTGIEKVGALLADMVADKVVEALMKAGFDKGLTKLVFNFPPTTR